MNPTLLSSMKGAAKSVTIWAGGVLLALGQIAPYIDKDTLAMLGLHGASMQRTLTVAGLIMWACRMITTKSLAEKGGASPLPSTSEKPK